MHALYPDTIGRAQIPHSAITASRCPCGRWTICERRLASLSRRCRGRLSTMEITVRAADLQAGDSLVRHGLVVRNVEEGGIGAEGRPVVVLTYEDGQSNTFLAERTFKVIRHLTETHAQLRNNGTGD